jgi:hypothetical protein
MRPKVEVDQPMFKGLNLMLWPAAGLVHLHNLQPQKSPGRIFDQNSGNSVDLSKAFFERGTSKLESSQVSQPVTQLEIVSLIIR